MLNSDDIERQVQYEKERRLHQQLDRLGAPYAFDLEERMELLELGFNSNKPENSCR